MRLLKLMLISVVAFSLLLLGFSLLFPDVTVLSRVRNMPGSGKELLHKIQTNEISFRQWLLPEEGDYDVRTADISFYRNDLFNYTPQPDADTLYFEIRQSANPPLQGGIATYQLQPDSATTQLFYVFRNPWYRPWDKFKMMVADKQIGPQMEGALRKLYGVLEKE